AIAISVGRVATHAASAGMKSARSASSTTASTTGRRYARSIEPQSVMGTPTASDARRLTVAEMVRRNSGSTRAARRVPTASYPASSLKTGTTIETAGVSPPAGMTVWAGSADSGRMATEHVGERVGHVANVVFDHRGEERQGQDRVRRRGRVRKHGARGGVAIQP